MSFLKRFFGGSKTPSPPNQIQALDQSASIHDAAKAGDLERVKALLKGNPNLVSDTLHAKTPLHHAAEEGHEDVAELLLANKANVNADENQNYKPLHWAASKGHKGVVELLLANGAQLNARTRFDDTPFHLAVCNGHKEVVELLLAKGAEVNAKDRDGHTPLDVAALNGHKDVVELLCKHGGHPTIDQSVYFLEAAEKGDLEKVRALLQDHPDLVSRAANRYGQKALQIAASMGHKEVVELLLDKGADVEAKDNRGKTALHEVANKETAELLLAKGADVNAMDYDRDTPLHRMVEFRGEDMAEFLLAKGADVYAKNKRGWTPMDKAEIYAKAFFESVRQRGSIDPDPRCPECGSRAGEMSKRELNFELPHGFMVSYECPGCNSYAKVSVGVLDKIRGVLVRCESCEAISFIPPTVWCSKCGVGLSRGWQKKIVLKG